MRSKMGFQADPSILRFRDAGTAGLRLPLIVLIPPDVRERFVIVSSGPITSPFKGPREAGSYWTINAFLIPEKSAFPLAAILPVKFVEPAVVFAE